MLPLVEHGSPQLGRPVYGAIPLCSDSGWTSPVLRRQLTAVKQSSSELAELLARGTLPDYSTVRASACGRPI